MVVGVSVKERDEEGCGCGRFGEGGRGSGMKAGGSCLVPSPSPPSPLPKKGGTALPGPAKYFSGLPKRRGVTIVFHPGLTMCPRIAHALLLTYHTCHLDLLSRLLFPARLCLRGAS